MQRQKLNEALDKRDKMEKRMKEIIEYLNQPGPNGKDPVGLHGNLLDSEGYPRDDIDLYKIREYRHELALLRTDYEELTNSLTDLTYAAFAEIQKNPQLHQEITSKKETSTPCQNKSVEQPETKPTPIQSTPKEVTIAEMTVEDDPLLAAVQQFEREQSLIENWVDTNSYFGSVRSIAEGSVAAMCGIEDCDRLISFGTINVKTFRDLRQLAEYFESVRGTRIEIIVGRNKFDHYEKHHIFADIPKDPSQRLGIHFIPR